ncbi:MAG: site-specific DNA-methyltransferase [Hyphomicrobiaceae bacterium]
MGRYFVGGAEEVLRANDLRDVRGKVQLVLTSPPFPLNHKKKYGNKTGEEYVAWLSSFAPLLSDLLTENGSIVIELGNGWLPGRPVQSLLTLESLMAFVKHADADLRLCQEFISYNPSRMPSPAQWVTVERSRLTDSFTHIWWMAKTDFPKADNRRVLRPYSESMKKLLETRQFNRGGRPSGFRVSDKAFMNDNGGAIAHNLFELEDIDPAREARLPNAFSFANTASVDYFSRACRERKVDPHPARMPSGLANFFVQFLTEPGDLVLDPFAGSNTTGYVAEINDRRWVSIEQNLDYAEQSQIRLDDPALERMNQP